VSEPTRTTVQVDVPKVSNTIDVSELLGALRDFAAREAGAVDPAVPAEPAAAPNRASQLAQVQELAAQLADLVEQIPDFPRRPSAPPTPHS
jgi:hypothetical protein